MKSSAFSLLAAAGLWLGASAALAQTEVAESREMNADGQLSFSAVVGEFEFIGSDTAELGITGTLGPEVEEMSIEGDASHWTIKIKPVERHFGERAGDGETRLTVSLPRGAELRAQSVSGSLSLLDLAGPQVVAKSVSGDIEMSGMSPARLSAETVSGTLTLDSGGREATRLQSVSGHIEAFGLTERVHVQSVSGQVSLSVADFDELELETVSGRISGELRPREQARIDASSHSGSLSLALPESTALQVSATTFSGSIDSELGGTVERGRGPGQSLEFSRGDNPVRIEAKSFSGQVRLIPLD